VGPTAVGKTGVSLAMAEDGSCEIISADSVQVYKYLDIGSGKPERIDRERIRHYMIDVVDPDVPFTAGDFCREARQAAAEIASHRRVPLIVGGTGLYVDSFFQGLSDIPEIPGSVREAVREELAERGLQSLYDELLRVDPGFGGGIHPNDTQRITRGLEVYRGTGRPLSSYYDSRHRYGSDDTLYLGLHEDRLVLRKRIDERVDRMMARGFAEEVRSLRERGYGPELKSMKSIGYAEINSFIDGRMNLEETVDAIKTVTKKYAKRQMTWFGKNKRIYWFRINELEGILNLLQRWLDGREVKINKNR
jgi:tRNA dimethylallyltransferase